MPENGEGLRARIRRWLVAALIRLSQPPPVNEREAMWSIPASFLYVYFGLMLLLCAPPLAVIVAEQAAALPDESWWMKPITVIRRSATEFGPVGIGNAIAALIIAQGGYTIMVLYYHMLSKLVDPIIKRHEERGEARGEAQGLEKGLEEGRKEGLEEGRAEGAAQVNEAWRGWNQRRLEHEAQGLPFDEQPPDQEAD